MEPRDILRFVNRTPLPISGLVSIYGFDPQTGIQTCEPAIADGSNHLADGYVAVPIRPGQIGEFARDWILAGTAAAPVNTAGMERGDLVYLSPSTQGGWTLTTPSPGQDFQIVGSVLTVHATRGRIRFRPRYSLALPASAPGQLIVHQRRIQLADLPIAATTGAVAFGSTIAANRVIIGAGIRVNAAVDLGASGIGVVNLSLAAQTFNIVTTTDLVGVAASTWVNGFTDGSGSFATPPFVTNVAGQPRFSLASDGPALSTLAAFDITVFVFELPTTLSVP